MKQEQWIKIISNIKDNVFFNAKYGDFKLIVRKMEIG